MGKAQNSVENTFNIIYSSAGSQEDSELLIKSLEEEPNSLDSTKTDLIVEFLINCELYDSNGNYIGKIEDGEMKTKLKFSLPFN